MKEDFSMKWFGIPDAVVVRHWEQLERVPKITKEQFDREIARRKQMAFRHPAYIMPPPYYI